MMREFVEMRFEWGGGSEVGVTVVDFAMVGVGVVGIGIGVVFILWAELVVGRRAGVLGWGV
jgi:hypothetical protein